ncbi:MAG: amino acid permease [Phycisphaerae bacterium]|nr:amino acid permease [Phycisphaerae bacterium]
MRRKSVEHLISNSLESGHQFRRTLDATHLVMLGIGGIIGAGIFVLTGKAAAQYAGPAVIYSFMLSGLGCVFAALCYAEFAAMIPVAGSAYTYAYATLGEMIAWIIGWDLILEYLFGASTVAVGWSGYLVDTLKQISAMTGYNLTIPDVIAHAPLKFVPGKGLSGFEFTGAIINLPAVLICATCTLLLVVGIRESARFNNIIVVIKVAVILAFVAFGFSFIRGENHTPFVPPNDGTFGHFGWSGVVRAAAVIFFAYIGFDAVSTLAQEAKNPQRDMPIGIIGSLLVCTLLYVAVAYVMTGMVHYTKLNDAAPVAIAINAAGDKLSWLGLPIKIGALAGLSSVVLTLLMGQPRIFFSMSRDGLLPPVFSKMHPKFGTPYVATILTGTLAAIIAGIFPIDILGELVSIGTLLAFVIVCLGVWYLRVAEPNLQRPFRTPMVAFVSIAGALISVVQMGFLPLDTWYRLLGWMALGFVVYFAYGRSHSVLGKMEARGE